MVRAWVSLILGIDVVDLLAKDGQGLTIAAHVLVGGDHVEQQLGLGLAQVLAAGADVGPGGFHLGVDRPVGEQRLDRRQRRLARGRAQRLGGGGQERPGGQIDPGRLIRDLAVEIDLGSIAGPRLDDFFIRRAQLRLLRLQNGVGLVGHLDGVEKRIRRTDPRGQRQDRNGDRAGQAAGGHGLRRLDAEKRGVSGWQALAPSVSG